MSPRAFRLALLASVAAAALACSDSTSPSRAPVDLAFAAREARIGVGDTLRLVAAVLDAQGGVLRDEPVTWRSLDPARASVAAATGLALALDTGTARVVATAGELADTATLHITRRVAELRLQQVPDSLLPGGAVSLGLVALDANGVAIPDAPVLWSSSDSTVVGINSFGNVFAVREGVATVRAISGAARVEASIRTRYRRMQYGFVPKAIAMGGGFTCLLDQDGRAHCGGSNTPALGRGTTGVTPDMGPVSSDERFATLEADQNTACAITAAGRLFCWGRRAGGGTQWVPTAVVDSVPMRAVSVGTEGITCALGTDGIGRCWGRNDAYQTGYEPLGEPAWPQAATTDERFVAIAAGFHDACGIALDGVPVCWGEFPAWYEGGSMNQLRFLRITGAPPLVSVAINGYANACGLTATGETWCWGVLNVSYGGTAVKYAPARVAGVPAMRELHGTGAGICGLGTNGEVWCWGDQAGNNTPSRWRPPYLFRTIDATGLLSACGVTTEDEVIC